MDYNFVSNMGNQIALIDESLDACNMNSSAQKSTEKPVQGNNEEASVVNGNDAGTDAIVPAEKCINSDSELEDGESDTNTNVQSKKANHNTCKESTKRKNNMAKHSEYKSKKISQYEYKHMPKLGNSPNYEARDIFMGDNDRNTIVLSSNCNGYSKELHQEYEKEHTKNGFHATDENKNSLPLSEHIYSAKDEQNESESMVCNQPVTDKIVEAPTSKISPLNDSEKYNCETVVENDVKDSGNVVENDAKDAGNVENDAKDAGNVENDAKDARNVENDAKDAGNVVKNDAKCIKDFSKSDVNQTEENCISSLSSPDVHLEKEANDHKEDVSNVMHNSKLNITLEVSSKELVEAKSSEPHVSETCDKSALNKSVTGNRSKHSNILVAKHMSCTDGAVSFHKNEHKEKADMSENYAAKQSLKNKTDSTIKSKLRAFSCTNDIVVVKEIKLGGDVSLEKNNKVHSSTKVNNVTHPEKSDHKSINSSTSKALGSKANSLLRLLKLKQSTNSENISVNKKKDKVSKSSLDHKSLKQDKPLEKRKGDLCVTLKVPPAKRKKTSKKDMINNIIHEVLSTGSGPIKIAKKEKQIVSKTMQQLPNLRKKNILKFDEKHKPFSNIKTPPIAKLKTKKGFSLQSKEDYKSDKHKNQNNVFRKVSKLSIINKVDLISNKHCSKKEVCNSSQLSGKESSCRNKPAESSENDQCANKRKFQMKQIMPSCVTDDKKLRQLTDKKQNLESLQQHSNVNTSNVTESKNKAAKTIVKIKNVVSNENKLLAKRISNNGHRKISKSESIELKSKVRAEEDYDGNLRVSKFQTTKDNKICITLCRSLSYPGPHDRKETLFVPNVPKNIPLLASNELSKSTLKHQEHSNKKCSSSEKLETKSKGNKKNHISSVSDDIAAKLIPKESSIQMPAESQGCASLKSQQQEKNIPSIQSVSIKNKNDKKELVAVLKANKDVAINIIQSEKKSTTLKKNSRKVMNSEQNPNLSLKVSETDRASQDSQCKNARNNSDITLRDSSGSSEDTFQNKPRTSTVKKKIFSSTLEKTLILTSKPQDSLKETQLSEVETKVDKKARCTSVNESSRTLAASLMSTVQYITEHARTLVPNRCDSTVFDANAQHSEKSQVIVVPLDPNDMNSVHEMKRQLNLVMHNDLFDKQNQLPPKPLCEKECDSTSTLAQDPITVKSNNSDGFSHLCLPKVKNNCKANSESFAQYNTSVDKTKSVSSKVVKNICEVNSNSFSRNNAVGVEKPSIHISKQLLNNAHSLYNTNDEPRVVVEKTPYLSLSLNEVSAFKDSDDDAEDDTDSDFDPDKSGINSSSGHRVVECRKRFRSSSVEVPIDQSNVQTKTEVQCDQTNEVSSTNLKLYSAVNVPDGNGISLSDIPCIVTEIQESAPETLQTLHGILFNVHGMCNNQAAFSRTKRHILNFSGFPFSMESPSYHALLKRLKRIHFQLLSEIESILFGSCLVNRSEAAEKVLNFLMEPTRKEAEVLRKPKIHRRSRCSAQYKELKRRILENDGKFPVVRLKRLKEEEIKSYSHSNSGNKLKENLRNSKDCSAITKKDDESVISEKESIGEFLFGSLKATTTTNMSTSKATAKISPPLKTNGIRQLGQPLKSFPDVASDINNADQQILSLIHVLLFGSDGDVAERKEHILNFSGFPSNAKSDLKNRKKFLRMISTCDLKKVCKVLHLKFVNKEKATMINGLLQFIKVPSEVFFKRQRATVKDSSKKNTRRKSSTLRNTSPSFTKPSTNASTETTDRKTRFGSATTSETPFAANFLPLSALSVSSQSSSSTGALINNATGELMLRESTSLRTTSKSKVISANTSVVPYAPEVKTTDKGKPLESFDTIRFNIECATPDDLTELYDLLFVKTCTSYEIHQRILQFNGFDFSEDSQEFHFRKTLLSYMDFESLKKIAKFLDLFDDYSHMHKNELGDRIMKFLVNLKDMKTSNKQGSCPLAKRTHIVRLGEKAETPSPLPSPSLPSPVPEPQMAVQPYQYKGESQLSTFRPEFNPLARRMTTDASSSSEDETESSTPLINFANHPSDSRLKKDVREVLYGKEFKLTMKELVALVYARYPQYDLRYRSNFIKSKARHVLSTLPRS